MDGLREDAQLLFVLTTNRPDQLESALASRPGRIDQAIEFPLPDLDGRRRLVHLYARGLRVPDDIVQIIVARTAGASAAFIKELMRRSAQYALEAESHGPALSERAIERVEGSLEEAHVGSALDEMLFAGGMLNLKLLGGAASYVAPDDHSRRT